MANEIVIPRLGWNMDEGTFAGWLKPQGATVRAGDPLFTLESEKATQDIESFDPARFVAALFGESGEPASAGPAARST